MNMKHAYIAIAAAISLLAVTAVSAQDVNSGSESNSGASVIANIQAGVSYDNSGKSEVKNVPAVSAPAVFGGGHPCLRGKSGGVSVLGGGISYGEGSPEPACMAWLMGQPEIALSIMMSTSPEFCKAANSTGYLRIGSKTVPVSCGTRQIASSTSRSAPAASPQRGYTKCVKEDGKVRIRYETGANKELAQKACLRSLGYK